MQVGIKLWIIVTDPKLGPLDLDVDFLLSILEKKITLSMQLLKHRGLVVLHNFVSV